MYKCEKCGANLIFDPKSQQLLCLYCRNKFDPEKVTNFRGAKEEKKYETVIHKCTQCGAELLSTENTITTFCSYCGSFATLENKVTSKKKPDYIIPFKISKNECQDAYVNLIKKAIFAPKDMIDTQNVEKVRGIYMPYNIYRFEKHSGQYNSGEKYSHRVGDYVYYNQYAIEIDKMDTEYSGISHDASAKFSDTLSEGIAPFNCKEKKEFSPAYLSGFYADSEDISSDTLYRNNSEKLTKDFISKKLANDKDFKKYGCKKPQVDFNKKETSKALFPVYFISTKNSTGDRISYAIMNGQTGKIVAEIPIDFKKYITFSLILAIPIFFILNSFLVLTPTKVNCISILFAFISLLLLNKQSTKLFQKENMLDDYGYSPKNFSKKNKLKFSDKIGKLYKPLLAILLSIAIFVLHPVSDVYYYLTSIISIILVILSILNLININNLLTTRKLPHFDKRGGDENA